jgi:hypothetical protein
MRAEDINAVNIFASNGQKIYSNQQYSQPINLGKLSKGTYIVVVNTSNGTFSEKVSF